MFNVIVRAVCVCRCCVCGGVSQSIAEWFEAFNIVLCKPLPEASEVCEQ